MYFKENEDHGVQKKEKSWRLAKVPYWESNSLHFNNGRGA